ncbi:MAG: hypothetical protein ACE5LU_19060, partial [Anaerolineae bacterium]
VPEAGPGWVRPSVVGESAGLQSALQLLCRAMQSFDDAQEQLQRAIQLVEQFAKARGSEHTPPRRPYE